MVAVVLVVVNSKSSFSLLHEIPRRTKDCVFQSRKPEGSFFRKIIDLTEWSHLTSIELLCSPLLNGNNKEKLGEQI